MGGGRWNADTYSAYRSTHTVGKSAAEIFTARTIKSDYSPKNIKTRESRDSNDNPTSNAIIVAMDVTGSMGRIPHELIDGGLGTFITELFDKAPITDPHLMLNFFDDVKFIGDRSLQATQFEADIRIAAQMKELMITGVGGGNDSESYHLPLYFAAFHTSIDCFEKRNKKGLLFTFGDESVPPPLRAEEIEEVFGYRPEFKEMSYKELFEAASRTYDVFHLVVIHGGYSEIDRWRAEIGEHAIPVTDYTKIPEIMTSIIRANAGEDHSTIVADYKGGTAVAVRTAISGLTPTSGAGSSGVVSL